jgi:hypothetical protein
VNRFAQRVRMRSTGGSPISAWLGAPRERYYGDCSLANWHGGLPYPTASPGPSDPPLTTGTANDSGHAKCMLLLQRKTFWFERAGETNLPSMPFAFFAENISSIYIYDCLYPCYTHELTSIINFVKKLHIFFQSYSTYI